MTVLSTAERRVVYGMSRYRWGWCGWLAWPQSSDGSHWTDSWRPFKWMALRRAQRMARNANAGIAVPANADEITTFEWDLRKYGTLDPQPFGRAFRPWD